MQGGCGWQPSEVESSRQQNKGEYMSVPDRKRALEAAIAYIEKQFGAGSIMSYQLLKQAHCRWIWPWE